MLKKNFFFHCMSPLVLKSSLLFPNKSFFQTKLHFHFLYLFYLDFQLLHGYSERLSFLFNEFNNNSVLIKQMGHY